MSLRKLSVAKMCAEFHRGERVFLSSSTGEPTALVNMWLEQPENMAAIDLMTSFVPGINPLPVDRFNRDATVSGLFMHPELQDAARTGRFRHMPISYAGFVRYVRSGMALDTLVVHVAPPDENGQCSLGPTVEFVPSLLEITGRVLAVVNSNIPSMPGSVSIPFERIEAYCESDDPLRTYATEQPDPLSTAVGMNIAQWVGDETTLQTGIGKVPAALLNAIKDRRNLRFHSGMVSEALMALAASGALAPDSTVSCALLGSPTFYNWLADRDDIFVRGCAFTHDPIRLGELSNFVAVNSAIEVDLTGQANLEAVGAKMVSGVGGAPDFAHAASRSINGLSIVALPSVGPKGQSRIVEALGTGVPVSLPRHMIDIIVTEYGSADLRGKSVAERAEAIAAIADPAHSSALAAYSRTALPKESA